MKKTVLLVLSFLFLVSILSAQFWTENFNTGTLYSVTLGAEGEDGSADYFIRTDDDTGHNIGPSYTGINGFFFAGQDIDDTGWVGSANPSELTWSDIDISGQTNLEFRGKFASVATAGIDNSDYLHVQYNIDSGGWTNLIWFENDGTQYNTYFVEDTDFSGDGEGTQLISTFVEFTKSIPTTGSLISLRITCAANSGGEDFAFDDFQLFAAGGNSLPAITNVAHTPSTDITSSTTVSVSADVTDSDGTISLVELHWGLASGSLGTTINMSLDTGDTYVTDTDIPAQSDGVTVYYEVYAEDDVPESSTTGEYDYTVNDPESVPYSESFDNSTWPIGWTYDDFTIDNSNYAGGIAYEAELAYYNGTPGTSYFTSPAINTTGESELILSWKQHVDFYESGSGDNFIIRLDTSTDGSTFNNAWEQTVIADETTTKQVTLDSGDGVGSGTLYLRWLFYENLDNRLSYWRIDDITFDADGPVPVNLSAFYALYIGSTPTLYWTTQTETENAYWNVYRGTNNNFTEAGHLNAGNPVPGNGTTTSASEYVYVDNAPVVQNTTYWYWIEDVSYDGETVVHEPITLTIPFEDTPITPDMYGLHQNYPNPFNPSTSISFALAEESDVEVIIYNIKGAKIRTIFNDHVYADEITSIVWDGNDATGKQVSSGVYFYKLITETKEYQKKMLLVK